MSRSTCLFCALMVAVPACRSPESTRPAGDASAGGPRLPLVLVAEVDLPGGATRFDYQDVDLGLGRLVIAHMNDGVLLLTSLRDGSVLQQLPGMPTVRGVVVAENVGRTFATSSPNQLVIVDNGAMSEIKRVPTGNAPDGVGWDSVHKIVGVSDQRDGAISLIPNAGLGTRVAVKLGKETGNVVFDAARAVFWITVVGAAATDQLVAVDPSAAKITERIPLPGCSGAHGLRLHPDGKSAFVACEDNDVLARVGLDGDHAVTTGPTGKGADVLAIDPGLGWLYVAAESGDLTVVDIRSPGVALVGHDSPGPHSHTVAVDPATHRVFFPLTAGPRGKPVLRIMRPSGV